MSPPFLEGSPPPIATPLKWGERPKIRPRLDRRNFTNLEYMGSVVTNSRMRNQGDNFSRRLHEFTKHSEVWTRELEIIANHEYAVIQPLVSTVEKTVLKWESRPPFTIEEEIPHFKAGFNHFRTHYGPLMRNCIASDEQVAAWIDPSTSPGFPGITYGLRNKGDTMRDKGYQKFRQEFNFCDPAFHWVKDKREVLPMAKILENECRLFVIPELLLLEKQLKFGKLVSLALKEFGWSAYGFNPYSGGANKLAHRLLSKPYRFYYDISGWDKFLTLLKKIYAVQHEYIGLENMSEQDKREFIWMVENTVEMFCVLYDGSVYLKKYGNGSGSGTTTRDNIFAHVIIMATMLYSAYYDKFGRYPSPSHVEEQIINLFGDDSVCAVDNDFDHITEEFARKIFALFGMKLKFFFGGHDYPIEKMEFLGFSFKEIRPGQYVPLYNEKRLAAGLIYEGVNSNTREAIISKTFVLTFMSYPCEHHSFFRNYSCDLARKVCKEGNLSETEKVMCDLILTMSDQDIESAFLGLEASKLTDFSNFFLPVLEEVGIKDARAHHAL